MKIDDLNVYGFSIPLSKELSICDTCLSSRDGYVIRITTDNGYTGWGEISPLPGFSRENLVDVRINLILLHKWIGKKLIPEDISKCDGTFGPWLEPLQLVPSVRFGLESALIQILADANNSKISDMISNKCRDSIPVNALLAGDDVISQAGKLNSEGFRGFKLKVGHRSIEDDIILTQGVRRAIDESALMVVDANRAWDQKQLISFWEGVHDCNLEYIEEPLPDFTDYDKPVKEYAIPIALDESLHNMLPHGIESVSWARAIVLKPTLLGLETTIQYAREAGRLGMYSIFSSSFETSIGLSMLVHLAAAFGENNTPAGLDTLKWFSNDLSSQPLRIDNGYLEVSSAVNAVKSILPETMTEVEIG